MGEENRRGTDPLIIDMHGMIQRIDQKQDDTLRWVKSTYDEHKKQDDDRHQEMTNRLKPLEAFYLFIMAYRWIFIGVAGVISTGIGKVLWGKVHG